MRSIIATIIATSVFITSCQQKTENTEHDHNTSTSEVPADTIRKSIPKEEHARVGNAHMMIKYHAPTVRGRTIWGGLVPYGEVWVTGAHSATSIEFDKPITIAGTDIDGGKYALFTIPGQDKWTIILNKNWDQHLADEYDAKEDIIRLDVTPEQLPNVQERLKYTVVSQGNEGGAIEISWEKVKVALPFKVK